MHGVGTLQDKEQARVEFDPGCGVRPGLRGVRSDCGTPRRMDTEIRGFGQTGSGGVGWSDQDRKSAWPASRPPRSVSAPVLPQAAPRCAALMGTRERRP